MNTGNRENNSGVFIGQTEVEAEITFEIPLEYSFALKNIYFQPFLLQCAKYVQVSSS